MASISLPPQSQSTMLSQHLDAPDRAYTGHSRRHLSMSTPLPNPHFVFPARDPDQAPSQQPAPAPGSRSAAPLPAFSFNPGASHTSQPSLSVPPPNRPAGGHRRRPSEFVGDHHLVTPPTTETHQNNDEDSKQTPTKLPPPGPGFSTGGNARRHAHRRSAAVSSVDLTAIRQALDINVKPTIGSAPLTAADMKRDMEVHDEIPRLMSQSAAMMSRITPPASPQMPTGGSSPYQAKPETPSSSLTVPRPLSTVSSETAESTTTIQPERTARNSEPPVNRTPSPPSSKVRARPKTADASLLFNLSANDAAAEGSPSKRPLSSGHKRHKSMSSGILDAALRKKNLADDSHLTDTSRHSSSDDGCSDTSSENHDESPDPVKKQSSKHKKRQKKVRSWAGSILTRGKGKRHGTKQDSEQSPVPPVLTRTNSDFGSGLDVDFDDDNIVILRTPTNPAAPESSQATSETENSPTLESSWKPRSFYEQGTHEEMLSPVIDLDAALGPFNTPEMRSGGLAGSGFSVATKRMYSGGRRGEFVGPEMRYHRRTESAPEMPPFDRSALVGNRFSNNSVAENPDVFYEEEEDAFLAATSEPADDSDALPPSEAPSSVSEHTESNAEADDQSATSKDSSDTLTRQTALDEATPHNTGLGIRRNAPAHLVVAKPARSREERKQNAVDQLHQAQNPFASQPKSPVEILKQEEWQHRMPGPPSPDVSPRFLPADKQRPSTSPMEPMPPFSLQGSSSLPSSAFPSPDFHSSSPDAPRSITTSSTTDRKFSSPSYNMSMDFNHTSMEDVPSLTSSASTMTNTMHRFSATFFPRRGSNDRAASFSAAVNRRTSQAHAQKRSSLASLSKLMPGPHAEKSKLSYEEKPPGDTPEKTKKKGRRISRLMHFWRTKDKDRVHEHIVHEEQP